MRLELFFPPFLTAFAFSAGIILLILLVPIFRRHIWRSGYRHKGKEFVSRLGGLAMLIAFLMTFFLDPHLVMTRELVGLFAGAILILFFGLWDDVSELNWKVQVFFQVALTVIVFIFGMRITSFPNPLGGAWFFPIDNFVIIGFALLFVWMFFVMNAMNWLDGLDGLSGGTACITFLTIFFLSLKPEVNQPPIAILASIGMGATLGFLFFNVYPARIVAGTVGSMFLGFLIATLAIIAGTKIATALLVLALPIADAVWVIMMRLRARRSIFEADKRHLHYKLMELGWSERRISWTFFFATACIALIALSTEALGKFVAILIVLGIVFLFLFFVERKTEQKQREQGA